MVPSDATDYRIWRDAAAQVLCDRHDLAWGIMHEGAWCRLYVKGFNPEKAAHWARTWHNSLSFSERVRARYTILLLAVPRHT